MTVDSFLAFLQSSLISDKVEPCFTNLMGNYAALNHSVKVVPGAWYSVDCMDYACTLFPSLQWFFDLYVDAQEPRRNYT
jgi:hypothetical protein